MGSAARILDFQNVLSWASSGVIHSACISLRISLRTQSIHLPLGLPLGLVPGTLVSTTALTSLLSSILCMCPNHRSLISLTFSYILFFLTSTLFTLSLSVTPLILRNILNSVFSRICSSFFLTVQDSVPYRSTGLMTVVWSLIFNFLCIYFSLLTPDRSLHLPHAALTLALTASSDPLLH